MNRWRSFLARFRSTEPDPSLAAAITEAARVQTEQHRREQFEIEQREHMRALERAVDRLSERVETEQRAAYVERAHDLVEARQMAGAGPWLVAEARSAVGTPELATKIRESNPLLSQGGSAEVDLMLQSVEWRRETNFSLMEFSRWGIQMIILICRLRWVKNPIFRRLINVCAAYVFARGVEVSSSDPDANKQLKRFFARNKKAFGHTALVKSERDKDTDGNIFWCLMPDKVDTGEVNVRTIDPMEIMDIVCDPDDSDTPQFYRRIWTQQVFSPATGATTTEQKEAWHPALNYEPPDGPQDINGHPVMWGQPIKHRKSGAIAKHKFGIPRMYPAEPWAHEVKKLLESAASVTHALAEIARIIITKGGQQTIMGIKQQLQTAVGPTSGSVWDTNPPALQGSTLVAGSGTEMKALQTRGAGANPDEVYQYQLMCCMCKGVPVTFLGDVKTGNLATATSLERTTLVVMEEAQEEWVEDLEEMGEYSLKISAGAPSGRLAEALRERKIDPKSVAIQEAAYTRDKKTGRRVYEKTEPMVGVIEVKCVFPPIVEGDIPALVGALVQSMTLGNRGGQIVGIDEKAGVAKLGELNGIEDSEELAEVQYPKATYKPDRTQEVLPPPIGKLMDRPGGTPVEQNTAPTVEAVLGRMLTALQVWEAEKKGPGSAQRP